MLMSTSRHWFSRNDSNQLPVRRKSVRSFLHRFDGRKYYWENWRANNGTIRCRNFWRNGRFGGFPTKIKRLHIRVLEVFCTSSVNSQSKTLSGIVNIVETSLTQQNKLIHIYISREFNCRAGAKGVADLNSRNILFLIHNGVRFLTDHVRRYVQDQPVGRTWIWGY